MNVHDFLNELFGIKKQVTPVTRTVKNSDKRRYNCAGYALKTFTWFDFYDFNYYPTMRDKNKAINRLAKILIKAFPTIRIIKNLTEVTKNEYPIAFRLSSHDFHFICRGKNNHWYHKMGNAPKINCITKDEVFSEKWESACEIYDSKIVLFAKQWD